MPVLCVLTTERQPNKSEELQNASMPTNTAEIAESCSVSDNIPRLQNTESISNRPVGDNRTVSSSLISEVKTSIY